MYTYIREVADPRRTGNEILSSKEFPRVKGWRSRYETIVGFRRCPKNPSGHLNSVPQGTSRTDTESDTTEQVRVWVDPCLEP